MTEATQNAPGQPVGEHETRSQWRDVWDQFTKHKGALIGGILFFAIVFAVMLGPSLWPYEANEINIRLQLGKSCLWIMVIYYLFFFAK